MAARRYLIVGGSAAGMAAAHTIRRQDPAGDITVIGEENEAPYFRPMIPYVISKQKYAHEIRLSGQGPYTAENIQLATGTRATAIDSENCRVHTLDGKTMAYDRLLVATGSRPHIPEDIEGRHHPGVYALRTLSDARKMAQRARSGQRAVMLGGGILNLKAAFALLECGMHVTLVVLSPEVLSQLMEPADALLIRQALEGAGLEIITGRSARRILSDDDGVCAIDLDDGTNIDCRMVCIGKGVRPNVQWLAESALDIDGGVVVNPHTATNVPDVFAAGDVAVTFDPITDQRMVTGLWTNAVEMGRCAGANMAGQAITYSGTFGIMNATQIARMPFVSMGIVHTATGDWEVHTRSKTDAFRKLVFSPDGRHLVGAVFIGDIDGAGLYRFLIREKMPVKSLKAAIIDHRLQYGNLIMARRGQ